MTSPSSNNNDINNNDINNKAPIAICGYSYRLPGNLNNDEDFWNLLSERGYVQECIQDRYGEGVVPWDGFTDENPLSFASPYEGLMKDGKELEFDCPLFGISVNDAKRMDPQIKMMLMVTWEALQCAGMDQAKLHNSNTGVFTGIQTSSISGWRTSYGAQAADVPGKSGSMIANRISFHFNWMGPSFSVATACSSGITALDAAVKSLHIGECDLAAFGAVHYLGHAQSSVGFNALGIISKTGTSRSFDKDANGYMRSEGAFIYILKRLDDAERDGDKIFGVIKGCALNCAGAELNAELLTQGRMIVAPVMHAQQSLMQKIVDEANWDPYTVDYIEAHATGTVLGDAIEGNAIAKVYGSENRKEILRIASVRSNVGHMESASFTCSFLKILLMLQKRQFLPISSHHKEVTDKIPFEQMKMRVLTEVEPFPDDRLVKIGINSFGFGGANGHCIIEEYKQSDNTLWSFLPGNLQNKIYMIPLSAKSDDALIENARRLGTKLEEIENQKVDMYTLVGNLSVRMTHHRIRTALTASNMKELKDKLKVFTEKSDLQELADDEMTRIQLPHYNKDDNNMDNIVMIFPGQGSQWAGCGRELYESELVFRRVVDSIDTEWLTLAGCKLSDIAFDENIGDKLNECIWSQPVTFLLQVGMYELFLSYGIQPRAVIGHSAGEPSAAYASGAYTLKEACFLVYHRSRLQTKLAGCGRMLVLMMDKTETVELLNRLGFSEQVEIACYNSQNNTVVCGTTEEIKQLQDKLEEDGQPNGTLIVGNIAFHSKHMMPIKDELLESIASLDQEGLRCGTIPMISTVTGSVIKKFDANYWWDNVRQPVDLISAVTLAEENVKPKAIIELSPHITLRSPIRDYYNNNGDTMPHYIYTLVRKSNTADLFSQALGNCFKIGLSLNFGKIFPRPKPITNIFPHYAMKLERVLDNDLDDKTFTNMEWGSAGALLGRRVTSDHLSFQCIFSKKHFSWMCDHIIQGQPIVPAAGYMELLFQVFQGKIVYIESARFLAPFVLNSDAAVMHTDLFPCQYAPNTYDFKIFSSKMDSKALDYRLHVTGVISVVPDMEEAYLLIPETIHKNIADDKSSNFSELVYKDKSDFYQAMSARIGQSYGYGPYFQGISKVEFDIQQHRVRFDVRIDRDNWEKWDKMGYNIHPTMLDSALQSFLIYLMESSDFAGIPQTVNNFVKLRKPTSEHIVVIYEPPDYLRNAQFHQKGQLAFALGERSAGRCILYDGATGDLITYLGDYTSFGTNSKISDLQKVKHTLSWQPKDIIEAKSTVADVISTLKEDIDFGATVKSMINGIISNAHPTSDTLFFLNVGEFCIGSLPERLALEDCIQDITNAPVQYSVVAEDTQFLSDSYQKFGVSNSDANLRFTSVGDDMTKGLLRPGMFELLVIRLDMELTDSDENENEFKQAISLYEQAAALIAPGCFILVESNGKELKAPSTWNCVWESRSPETAYSIMIFSSPPLVSAINTAPNEMVSVKTQSDGTVEESADTAVSVVIDDSMGFSEYWKSFSAPTVTEIDFEKSLSWNRVDYFAMHEDDDNAELFDGPTKLTDFIKDICLRRSGSKDSVPCIFTIFTSGAMLSVTSPSQTGIWGAVRSLALEVGDAASIDFHLVDIATKQDLHLVPACEKMRERELCIHNGRLWACRLINNREMLPTVELKADDPNAFRLITNNSGLIGDLEFRVAELPTLQPYEVEVSVKAAALNFRDIMIGLGKLPLLSFEASMLGRNVGMECAGVVVRCGSEVRDHIIGDKVLAMQGGCIANRLCCHEKAAYALPKNLTFEEGSATASVYVTAYYALVDIAKMKEGQTILVHSALGGVGQASIALAKLYGAKIYGTAGSEEKRQVLREMGCEDAFDSHSIKWYTDLMTATNGRGVDIVLNSLAGEHVDLCLEALSPGGFHCEIGKVDIFQDRPMKMSVFRKNIAFRAIDVDRLMTDNPRLTRDLTMAVLKLIEEGKVPALPYTEYSYNDYQEALRFMMNGQHRGKIVLTPPGPNETIRVVDDRKIFGTGKDGSPRTVLMSGCLGGFGLRVVAYVIALGARNVVLLDRDVERKRSVKWVLDRSYVSFLLGEIKDLRIEIVYGDVGIYDHCVDAVSSVERLGMPAIGSVFHLAGILDDKKVEEIDRASFERVYQPKAKGALNLHNATLAIDTIDHFVMFSSTSSAFGNPGQVNYSAANSYQDGLACMRRQNGKPALSFCMGAVIESGMASLNPQLLQMMKAGGMPAISCIFAIEALDAAIRSGSHWNAVASLAKDLPANYDSNDYLRIVAQLIRNNAAFKMGDSSNLSKESLVEILSERVGKLCGVDKLDPTEPFSSYGLNSISVAELATYLKNEMSYTVSAMELMTSATCESIAEGIIQASLEASKEKESTNDDEATNTTAEESDSGTNAVIEEDPIWLERIAPQSSLFEPTTDEYFIHPPSYIANDIARQDKTLLLKVDSGKVVKETNSVSDPLNIIGSLDDKLPIPCQDAINELTSFIDSLDVSAVEEAVCIKNIKTVLLTGATGFVGRHFIAELLNFPSTYIETIYCPIRASSDTLAMERLVIAMEEAGIWKEEYASRLHVFSGDLEDEYFGLSQAKYKECVTTVDAVYHFASNLNLTASFDALRNNNCKTMRTVFRFCLSVRQKHLFLASTLGIFPQYFCQFANEMTNKEIALNAFPEVSVMKRIFPLAVAGYPWSKLINELAVLKAKKAKGLCNIPTSSHVNE